MTGTAGWPGQEQKVIDHAAHTARNQRKINVCAPLTHLIQSKTSPPGKESPVFGTDLPSSVNVKH